MTTRRDLKSTLDALASELFHKLSGIPGESWSGAKTSPESHLSSGWHQLLRLSKPPRVAPAGRTLSSHVEGQLPGVKSKDPGLVFDYGLHRREECLEPLWKKGT